MAKRGRKSLIGFLVGFLPPTNKRIRFFIGIERRGVNATYRGSTYLGLKQAVSRPEDDSKKARRWDEMTSIRLLPWDNFQSFWCTNPSKEGRVRGKDLMEEKKITKSRKVDKNLRKDLKIEFELHKLIKLEAARQGIAIKTLSEGYLVAGLDADKDL